MRHATCSSFGSRAVPQRPPSLHTDASESASDCKIPFLSIGATALTQPRAARQARRPWRTSFVAHRPSPRPAVQSHPIPFHSTRCTSQARAAAPRSGADRIGSRGNGRWLRGHSSAGGWKEADALRRRRRWHREGDLLLQQLHRHEPFLRRAQLLRSDAATHDTMQRTTYAVQRTTRNMQSRSCNGNRATCHIGKSASWTIGPEGKGCLPIARSLFLQQ